MISFLLFVALSNLILGYVLGAFLLRTGPAPQVLLAAGAAAAESTALTASHHEMPLVSKSEELKADIVIAAEVSTNSTLAKPPKSWNTACLDIRHDITTLRDRIHYGLTANDKSITKELAFELQTRTPAWQQLLHDKLTALTAELERDPAAKVDCSEPELCLAQIETLQSNLKILDWSESSESILKKLEREVDLVKNLVPRGM